MIRTSFSTSCPIIINLNRNLVKPELSTIKLSYANAQKRAPVMVNQRSDPLLPPRIAINGLLFLTATLFTQFISHPCFLTDNCINNFVTMNTYNDYHNTPPLKEHLTIFYNILFALSIGINKKQPPLLKG